MSKKNPHRIDLSQRLFIELGTSILIETHGKGNPLSGKLVGMKVGDYLIVDISEINSDNISLSKQDPVLVKYVNLEDIFNFSSMLLRVLTQRDSLVFLQYPDMVESGNIRSHKRVDCFLPIRAKTGDFHAPGVAVNISARGCLCMVDHSHLWKDINTKDIELLFSYGDLETLSIIGEIRTSQIQGSKIKLSIKFNKINTFSQSIISTLVPALRL